MIYEFCVTSVIYCVILLKFCCNNSAIWVFIPSSICMGNTTKAVAASKVIKPNNKASHRPKQPGLTSIKANFELPTIASINKVKLTINRIVLKGVLVIFFHFYQLFLV